MVGWQYDGPFDELPAQQHPSGFPAEIATVVEKLEWGHRNRPPSKIHRVIAWDVVGETEGTGIVHIAPGCGKEDFAPRQGARRRPAIAPLDDSGVFLDGFGELTGKSANDPATTDWILDNLQKKGRLLAVEKYPHSYPHCWRCKTELLFRLVDEWFIDMKWRDEIMQRRRERHLPPRIDQRQGPRARLAQEHGRLDDLQETLLGSRAPHLGR